jgi:hypothetical protein
MIYFYYSLRYNQFDDISVEIMVSILREERIEFI